jgi:nucleoside-diphosphate-sugar epimerase
MPKCITEETTDKKILITGGAGYIGSILVGELLNNNYEVTVVDSLMYSQQSLLQYIPNKNFKFVWGDVSDHTDELQQLILDSDVVIPLACIVGAPATTRCIEYSRMVNYLSIFDLVQTCNGFDDSIKIIFATTNSGYGTKSGEVYCSEETPLRPISPYGVQKVDAENFLLTNYKNVITLRLATVFGVSPRMRLDLLVNFFVYKAITEGVITIAEPNQKRNYVHIQDVSSGFLHCINNFESMKGNAYNLGLNANHSKGELVEIVKSFTGCEVLETQTYKDPDKRNYIVSNEKINKTGFVPNIQVEDAIPELIECCKMLSNLNYGRQVNKNY